MSVAGWPLFVTVMVELPAELPAELPRVRVEVKVWLDAAPPEIAPTVSGALMDGSLADVADPPGLLRKLSARLQLQRLEAEMAMNERQSREFPRS